MSLLLALDPGASPGRPGCEARGCPSTTTSSVRAYLGRIHPTTIRVCETHRRGLEVIGDLENPVICCYPPCGRTRAPSSRLCAEHDAIIVAAKINIPRKGVISAETLVAIRKAIEAAEATPAKEVPRGATKPPEPEGWVFGPDLSRALDGKRAVGNDPLVLQVQRVVADRDAAAAGLAQGEKDLRRVVEIAELRGDEVRAASAALTALGVPVVQPDPLRVQATTVDGLRVAVEWALDEAKAPQAASLTDRIAALAGQRDELRAHLDAIRKALNVGPPSDSDVQPGTSPERLTEIVRARTVCMLDERDQRVALAEEVEALKKTLGDPLAPAVDALVAWLSGPGGEQAHKGFKTGLLYALYRRAIEPMAAAEALGGLRALARLILSTPEPFDLPF